MNSLTLAYLGDAVYEVYIRNYLIQRGITKVNSLQKIAIQYVSAKGQASILTCLLNEHFLTEIEEQVFLTARNHKSQTHPKNTDVLTYKHATGFEAIIGYLYINDMVRLQEVMNHILTYLDKGGELCIFMEKM